MPEAIFKFGADERNSMQAIARKRWETQKWADPRSLALLDRIPDYDKKCNIIAVQISRSDAFAES